MKWIGQQIYDQVSRFRNDTYFEKDVYFQGDTVTFTSANADDPAVIIENTTADAQAARLQLKKHRGVDAVDGDNIGEIEFWGYDDGTPSEQRYGLIRTEIHDATSGEESGSMLLAVANHDGGTNTGLKLTGGSANNEIDVEIGRGGGSVTDVQGTLSMGGTAAMTNAGLLSVANQSNITGLGTITSGVWNGTAIASAYLDADTAHLSGTQTFTGIKTFARSIIFDGDKTITPGDGVVIHVDTHDITDGNTSASGTAAMYTHVNIEAPRLLAVNSSVTTTNAASLYIKNAPVASTNQTITNAYALWVDDGNARFDGNIDLAGDIDVDGTLETDALTIGGATIAAIGTTSITTLGTITTGTWRGTAIAHDSIGADAIDGDNIADDVINSEHYVDGSIDTAHIADDQVTFAKALGVTPNIFDNKIKLIPSDFMANDDGGNQKFGVGYREDAGAGYGMRVGNNDTELYAFVSIPQGMTATHVDIFDKNDLANNDPYHDIHGAITEARENLENTVDVGCGLIWDEVEEVKEVI